MGSDGEDVNQLHFWRNRYNLIQGGNRAVWCHFTPWDINVPLLQVTGIYKNVFDPKEPGMSQSIMECTSQINKRSIYTREAQDLSLSVIYFSFHSSHTKPEVRCFQYLSTQDILLLGSPPLQFSLCATFRSNFLRDNSDHGSPAQKVAVNPYCFLSAVQTLNLKFNILYNWVPSSFTDQLPTISLQIPSTRSKLDEVTFPEHSSVLPKGQL